MMHGSTNIKSCHLVLWGRHGTVPMSIDSRDRQNYSTYGSDYCDITVSNAKYYVVCISHCSLYICGKLYIYMRFIRLL